MKYDDQYLQSIISEKPTWFTCVDLFKVNEPYEIGRLMGGISSAIRNGSEITIEDWGVDWLVHAANKIHYCDMILEMSFFKKYEEMDKWLKTNEQNIINSIHQLLVNNIKSSQQGDAPELDSQT